mmetsp:Transcript_38055/g.89044  ORF Transcript_38055/g.89044 Transcript_38055/m.89044 type:complete len:563 (+) Transcript_38055:225-1913(+)|eukprot:CAMPEP_0178402068 /NCGR_PEP_ID=MMETSP0689_2-20121128/16645_1 /TAXON_ID=160604 /ORGANISM="Amphidinium massartii, Strain CS-259" /LENGTH=562 /DNA_ID=CAMNT_0020022945 /DNA_START=225 /DNA_END=1913 /DNA_ORIENTATION=-
MFAAKYLAGAVCQQGEKNLQPNPNVALAAPPGLEGMLDLKALGASHSKRGPAGSKIPGKGPPQMVPSLQQLPTSGVSPPPALPPKKQQTRPKAVAERPVPLEPFPSQEDVILAIESLYTDRVKPWGRILRKRLVERQFLKTGGRCTKGREQLMHQIFMETEGVESVCRKNSRLRVFMDETGEVGDWSVELVDCSPMFVDVHSPVDVYPEEMWEAARAFFQSPAGQDLVLPKSRYDCACYLAGLELAWLAQRTLGEVCHIVQLCISQKKLLGQKRGCLVAFEKSDSKAKEQRAVELLPCKDSNNTQMAVSVATWDTLAEGLQRVLMKNQHIPLATLKQTFESTQNMKLSETALGYSKLSELLQDDHLKHVCQLQRESKGYFLVPSGALEIATPPLQPESKKTGKGGKSTESTRGAAPAQRAKVSLPVEAQDIHRGAMIEAILRNEAAARSAGGLVNPAFQSMLTPATMQDSSRRLGSPLKLRTDFMDMSSQEASMGALASNVGVMPGVASGLMLQNLAAAAHVSSVDEYFESTPTAGLGASALTAPMPWLAQRLLMRCEGTLV